MIPAVAIQAMNSRSCARCMLSRSASVVVPRHDVRDEGAPANAGATAIGSTASSRAGSMRGSSGARRGNARRGARAARRPRAAPRAPRRPRPPAPSGVRRLRRRLRAAPQREAVVADPRPPAAGAPRRRERRPAALPRDEVSGRGRGAFAAAPASMQPPRFEPDNGLDPRSIAEHRAQARTKLIRRKERRLLRRWRRVSRFVRRSEPYCARPCTPASEELIGFSRYFPNDNIEFRGRKVAGKHAVAPTCQVHRKF